MKELKAEKIRVGAYCETSIHNYKDNPERWLYESERKIVEELSHIIEKEKSKLTFTDDMVQKRLDLYVATPDIFWRIVNQEAMKLAHHFMPRGY